MFHFYDRQTKPAPSAADKVGVLDANLTSVETLMAAVSRALDFSGFSGNNFDAFWDSVRTLDGIKEKKAVLVHSDIPRICHDDLLVYVGLLRDAEAFWKKHADEHRFEVWFPKETKKKVQELLRKADPPYEEE